MCMWLCIISFGLGCDMRIPDLAFKSDPCGKSRGYGSGGFAYEAALCNLSSEADDGYL